MTGAGKPPYLWVVLRLLIALAWAGGALLLAHRGQMMMPWLFELMALLNAGAAGERLALSRKGSSDD